MRIPFILHEWQNFREAGGQISVTVTVDEASYLVRAGDSRPVNSYRRHTFLALFGGSNGQHASVTC